MADRAFPAEIMNWLLEGDVAIRFQTHRDLLDSYQPELQNRITSEGWGAAFLSFRQPHGHWGKSFYQPKWISTHYTLLDLKNLNLPPDNEAVKESIQLVLTREKGTDGGINPAKTITGSDVCVNGMVLQYACYFKAEKSHLESIVDFLLSQHMPDGGFNCRSNRSGATHSSLHSTLSVIEGIHEYRKNGYGYRLKELEKAEQVSQEFILMHKLFRSDKTGKIINSNFLKFHYPPRWYYDIFKALDYFQSANVKYDHRMDEAIEILIKKRKPQGWWTLAAHYSGQVHFEMEKAGKASRWNTLRALRILKWGEKL